MHDDRILPEIPTVNDSAEFDLVYTSIPNHETDYHCDPQFGLLPKRKISYPLFNQRRVTKHTETHWRRIEAH